jgi:hypothetical protein
LTNADVTSNVLQSIEYIHIDAPCVTAELRFATTALLERSRSASGSQELLRSSRIRTDNV